MGRIFVTRSIEAEINHAAPVGGSGEVLDVSERLTKTTHYAGAENNCVWGIKNIGDTLVWVQVSVGNELDIGNGYPLLTGETIKLPAIEGSYVYAIEDLGPRTHYCLSKPAQISDPVIGVEIAGDEAIITPGSPGVWSSTTPISYEWFAIVDDGEPELITNAAYTIGILDVQSLVIRVVATSEGGSTTSDNRIYW